MVACHPFCEDSIGSIFQSFIISISNVDANVCSRKSHNLIARVFFAPTEHGNASGCNDAALFLIQQIIRMKLTSLIHYFHYQF